MQEDHITIRLSNKKEVNWEIRCINGDIRITRNDYIIAQYRPESKESQKTVEATLEAIFETIRNIVSAHIVASALKLEEKT
jgi:hypothetical protein